MPPSAEGGATMRYVFAYHDEFPEMRVKDADGQPGPSSMRFPFGVSVYEQRADETEPRKVLEVSTRSVDVNTVVDKDFARPTPR
jgi:hypothetical protein